MLTPRPPPPRRTPGRSASIPGLSSICLGFVFGTFRAWPWESELILCLGVSVQDWGQDHNGISLTPDY